MLLEKDPVKAHLFCGKNKDLLAASQEAACFYCLRHFRAKNVEKWVGKNNQTALCPFCGIDSVLPDAVVDWSDGLLVDMTRIWFGK